MYYNILFIAKLLASIGAVNWGLIGLFDFNLVTFLFGHLSFLTKLVYILVGASGVVVLFSLFDKMSKPTVV